MKFNGLNKNPSRSLKNRQVFKEPIDFKVLDKVPVPRGLLQIVQGRAEEYTKYILTEEDRTAVEWVWGPSQTHSLMSFDVKYVTISSWKGSNGSTWVPRKKV